jgi:putative transposase
VLVTDRLASYGCARRQLGMRARHEQGLRKNNRAEITPGGETTRTEDAALQIVRFGAALPHSAVYNTFNLQRHLVSRRTLRHFRVEAAQHWVRATAA